MKIKYNIGDEVYFVRQKFYKDYVPFIIKGEITGIIETRTVIKTESFTGKGLIEDRLNIKYTILSDMLDEIEI